MRCYYDAVIEFDSVQGFLMQCTIISGDMSICNNNEFLPFWHSVLFPYLV